MSKSIDEQIEVHKPVVETMKRLGYGLLKDGKTFYKLGYEIEPRKHTTFTLTQAYEVHRLIAQAEKEARMQGAIESLEAYLIELKKQQAQLRGKDE